MRRPETVSADHESNIRNRNARSIERHFRRARTHLRIRDRGGQRRLTRILILRFANVVERKRGPSTANSRSFENPLVVGLDVEIFEKLIRDLILGMEMTQS